MKNLVVGAGLTGAVIAERLASKLGEEVTIIDKAPYIGGSHYDYVDKNSGILVQPKHLNFLHTDKKYVWDYLNKYSKMSLCQFAPLVNVQGKNISFPLSLHSLQDMFPENFGQKFEDKLIAKFGYNKKITLADMQRNFDEDLKFLANFFYENVYKPYTMKLWGLSEDEIPPCEDTYYPFYVNFDTRYYKNKYQAIPYHGWSEMIKNILNHRNIKLKLNTDFADINPNKYDRIFYTGSIDEYFDYKYGELPYRSTRIELDNNYTGLKSSTYNYPIAYDFLRTISYGKSIPNRNYCTCCQDIVGFEYVEDFELGKNERFYPIQNEKSQEILQKYIEEANSLDNVFFAGRLGEFKYYESDELVTRAFETVARLITKSEEINTEEVSEQNLESNENE